MTDTTVHPQPTRTGPRGTRIAVIAVIAVLALGTGMATLIGFGVLTLVPVATVEQPDHSPAPIPMPALPDGEMFAWITGVGDLMVTVDPAQMLSGEPAHEAAVEDGIIAPGEDLPNDYYIVNPSRQAMDVAVAANAAVTVYALDSRGAIAEARISLLDLAAAFAGDQRIPVYGLDPSAFPVTLTVEGGAVTAISQVYLP